MWIILTYLEYLEIFEYSRYLDPLRRLDPLTKVGPAEEAPVIGRSPSHRKKAYVRFQKSVHVFVCIGGWGCESNREIMGFLRCEWVRETMCFLSLGRAAPTCAAPSLLRSFSLVFFR